MKTKTLNSKNYGMKQKHSYKGILQPPISIIKCQSESRIINLMGYHRPKENKNEANIKPKTKERINFRA